MPTLKLGRIKGKHKKRKTIKINKAIDEERAKEGRSKGDAGRGRVENSQINLLPGYSTRLYLLVYFFLAINRSKVA